MADARDEDARDEDRRDEDRRDADSPNPTAMPKLSAMLGAISSIWWGLYPYLRATAHGLWIGLKWLRHPLRLVRVTMECINLVLLLVILLIVLYLLWNVEAAPQFLWDLIQFLLKNFVEAVGFITDKFWELYIEPKLPEWLK